jgi:hypothetical protein
MKYKLFYLLIVLFYFGCRTSQYTKNDFKEKSFVYSEFPNKTIIHFNDSSYTYYSNDGSIKGTGTWDLSEDKKYLILKGREYWSIEPVFPQKGEDKKMILKIKKRKILIDGDLVYKRE